MKLRSIGLSLLAVVILALVGLIAVVVVCSFDFKHPSFRRWLAPSGVPAAVDYRQQPLITAIATHDIRRATELLHQGMDAGGRYSEMGYADVWQPAIQLACKLGDLEMVKTLVEAGADPNGADCGGETAIAHMAQEGELKESDARILLYLTSVGGDCNARLIHGYTSLQSAVLSDNLPMAELLISCGARVNDVGPHGDTALHFACNRIPEKKPNPAIIRLLHRNGADPTIKNNELKTPADYMKEKQLDYLLSEKRALKGNVDK